MMRTSIWLMLDSRQAGGIETHVEQLAFGLNQQNYDVWVVFWKLYDAEHPLRSRLQQCAIKTLDLKGSLSRYLQAINKCKPDIIHTHGYKAGLIARLCGWFSKPALVASYHAGETPSGRVRLYDWLDRQSGRWSKARIAVSHQIAQRLPGTATVIANFIRPSDSFHSTQKVGDRIAFVGRLSAEKGPERVLQLAKQLPQQKFHIYGDGPMRQSLMQQAPTNVVFYGAVADMSVHWKDIGLLLLPSHAEGLPMVALEAMAHAIAIIATPVGGLPQLLEGVDGCHILPGDNIELWCQRISNWHQLSAQQKQQIGNRANARIEQQYSSAVVLPQFEYLYRQALTK